MKKRAISAVVSIAAAGTAIFAAPPAHAVTYHCTTSSKSIDDPGYTGPFTDNITFKVKVCAARSGSYVSTYSRVSWDEPYWFAAHQGDWFDNAWVRIYIKKSVSGPDPILRYYDSFGSYYGFLNGLNSGKDGSFTTRTISYKIGSSRGLGDAALKLDWNHDGAGIKTYKFPASPVI
jgi:hypothetical protein